MDYMQIYKDFKNLFKDHSDRIVMQKMLVKDEYYIWEQSTSVILLRFVKHHSEYDIVAKIIIYRGLLESEDNIPQVLTTSGGVFYKLNNSIV
jgi:hypothetical protein